MSLTTIFWVMIAGAGIAAIPLAVALWRLLAARWPGIAQLAGVLPLFALCLAATTGLAAGAAAAWNGAGERHDVQVSTTKWGTRCTFDWPTSSAARRQLMRCPDGPFEPGRHEAVRPPGTREVYLASADGRDPFSPAASGLSFLLVIAGGCGVARNAVRSDRRIAEKGQARLAGWYRDVASGDPRRAGVDNLTWEAIAAASEQSPAGGPLEGLGPPTGGPDAPIAPLAMGYPYAFVRIVTRPADEPGLSILLLFIGEDAWRVQVDGQPARSGTVTVTRNPAKPSDLRATIGGYGYDIADDPLFLGREALEALRRHTSRWVTTHPQE